MCTLDEFRYNAGKEDTMLINLKNLMSSLAIGLNEAMNLLKFSEEDKKKYSELMTKQEL